MVAILETIRYSDLIAATDGRERNGRLPHERRQPYRPVVRQMRHSHYKHRLLTLGDSGGTVGIATVSPCGRYIAAVRPGKITIWNGVLSPDLESSAQAPAPVSN